MKNLILLASFIIILPFSSLGQKFPTMSVGEQLADSELNYSMESVYNQKHSLAQHFNKKGLVLVFTSNTCPFVVAWEDRYEIVEEMCKKYDFDMLYINSNHNKRGDDDSFLAMQTHAKLMTYSFPYLLDEKSQLANALGAKTTPHIFMFSNTMELVYEGAIDDNYSSAKKVDQFYLKDAIVSFSEGNKISVPKTKAVGCSIKRYNP